MGSVLAILGANPDQTTVTVKCKLVVDKNGSFAGLVPVELASLDVLLGKVQALTFAEAIVAKVTEEGFAIVQDP
tara:strand:+ start:168 stop:389 length:222 start_codon:yes stop_codon:yes gene_type:complete